MPKILCVTQTHSTPGTAGEAAAISADDGHFFIRHSRIPYNDSLSLSGGHISWHLRTIADVQPTADEELIVLGGHIACRSKEMAPELRTSTIIAHRIYPARWRDFLSVKPRTISPQTTIDETFNSWADRGLSPSRAT